MSVILITFLWPAFLPAQDWEQKTLPLISYSFPAPNEVQVASNGTAVTYNDGDIFLTVTLLPDSSGYGPETRLEFSRYYKSRLNNVLLRLRGRLRVSSDTTIANLPMHYSSADVTMPDSTVMKYDMLQYYRNDTLMVFSCQYLPTSREQLNMRDRFFNHIDFGQGVDASGGIGIPRLLIYVLTPLALIAFFMLILRRYTGGEKGHRA